MSPSRQKLIVYLVLTIVTLAAFWQVTQYGFINFDDGAYVTKNSHVQSGITLDGFRWAFSTATNRLWNPLIWLSLMFDNQLFGLNAGGYHLTNLILHIMSTLLLFWLLNRMTGAIWKSAFVAALFALHPLHVESVAWIAERKDVLSAFFWMLTLCLYVYYTEKPTIRRYLLVLFSFVCGLMSKPMVVTLPVIMILLDYWPLGRFQSNKGSLLLWQLREKTPLFVLSAFLAIGTVYTMYSPTIKYFPLCSRFANAPVSFITYLGKTFFPHDMAVFYPFSNQLPVWQVMGSVLLIFVISVTAIAMMKHMPYFFVGWLWYAITLMPVIGIIQNGYYAMADRYTYLPSVGIFIMLSFGIPFLFPRKDILKKVLFPAAIAILFVLVILTWQQCSYWKNSITLFSHALQITKDNYLAHNNLGLALFDEGKIEEAINHYNKIIRITPTFAVAYNNRGTAYGALGQYQLAIEDFNKAIRLSPNYTDAYSNRANAYIYLGQHQRAMEDFNEAIRLNPNDTNAYSNRGINYFMQGNKNLGCSDAQKACALGSCKLLEVAKVNNDCP